MIIVGPVHFEFEVERVVVADSEKRMDEAENAIQDRGRRAFRCLFLVRCLPR